MIWNSLGDFLAMGGYALYVWGSVLAVALCLALELLALRLRRKAIVTQLASHKRGERA